MAKKKNNRRRNFVAIPFNSAAALTTLADDAVFKADLLINAFGVDIFIISVDLLASLRDLTDGQVPIRVGLAHNDLSTAEIDESNVSQLTDPDDIIQKERGRRPVRKVGVFNKDGTHLDLNNGIKIRVPMKFTVGAGHKVAIWVKNQSGATLTTGCVLEFDGVLYGRWLR